MTTGEIQQALFQAIRAKISNGASVADEVARLLEISPDSAYRRMRGEKTISIDELVILCRHFRIPADQLLGLRQEGVSFSGNYLDKQNFDFKEYIRSVLQNMANMNRFNNRRFYYLCKDLPIFHHYHCQEIASFKWFFWLKTYFQFPGFEKKKFRFGDHPEDIFEIEKATLDEYNKIPSVEIWNLEGMNIFLRQIEFYRDANLFESDQDIYRLYQAIEKTWDHLERQASLGYKFRIDDPERKPLAELKMYFNEVWLGDNTMLVELDGKRIAYMLHTTINYMQTSDQRFTANLYNHIENLMKKSTLISEVSEKERSRFFRIIRERISNRKEKLDL